MPEITIDHAIDIGYATLQNYAKDSDRLEMTFKEANYTPVNEWFTKDKMKLDGGDVVKFYITLSDVGNAKHIGLWEEDSDNTVNTDEEGTVKWTHATTNMSYNRVELGMNMGKGNIQVYNYLNGKRKNMFREFAEMLQTAAFLTPSSATDKKNPHGLPSWLSIGTDGSTGAFTGYNGHYNDGSAPGTAYSVGDIASSASSNARYASYYADHGGALGDNLIALLDRATRKTYFNPPILPNASTGAPVTTWGNFRYYSNDNVIGNMSSYALHADDAVGKDLGKYAGLTIYKGIPFIYVQQLDTANTSTYGTDPIFGVNHDFFYPIVLTSNNFVIGKPVPRDQQHLVLKVHLDLSYAYVCINRQRAGFLINQQ
ncbi:MAG: hypothetical protein WC451_03210 [Patescibacteria group bacterium]|jgi:hypothetical protein